MRSLPQPSPANATKSKTRALSPSADQPHDFQIPFPPLVEMHAAQGRLQHLSSLMPAIVDTRDTTAINAALDYALDLNHLTNELAERAAD